MQIWAETGKSALPIHNYSQILYQFLTFTQNLKRPRRLFGVSPYKSHSNLSDTNNAIFFVQDKKTHSSFAFCESIKLCIISDNFFAALVPADSHAIANSSVNSFFNLYDFEIYPTFFWYFSEATVCLLGFPFGILNLLLTPYLATPCLTCI